MEISLKRYGEVPELSKVKKCLRGENGIQIGRNHENHMLDTRVDEVEYLDEHKVPLSSNTIAEHIFSQFYEEGDILMLFDEILYNRVDGTDIMNLDAFILKKRRKKTKVDYQRMEQYYSVEIWINDMGDNERCKEMIPIADSFILLPKTNLSGTCICMVCPTFDE